MNLEIKEKLTSNILYDSLPDIILDILYEDKPIVQQLGLEEYLNLPVNELYKQNKLKQNVELNSNTNIIEDVKSNTDLPSE